jgi:hypothetical protein
MQIQDVCSSRPATSRSGFEHAPVATETSAAVRSCFWYERNSGVDRGRYGADFDPSIIRGLPEFHPHIPYGHRTHPLAGSREIVKEDTAGFRPLSEMAMRMRLS